MSKLQSMLKDTLEAWVPFDGLPGFEVKLAYLARPELERIRKASTRPVFKKHQKEDELDGDMFMKHYVKASILDWKGLTLEYASQLLPIEVPKDIPLNETIDFSPEEALSLVKNSPEFDKWLNEIVFSLDSFRSQPT
jgi:hypothetical protein